LGRKESGSDRDTGRQEGLALGAPAPAEFARTRADLESFRRGDPQSFERIWNRYRPAIEVLVAGRIRSGLEFALRARLDAEAEDVVQEVAATVFEKLSKFGCSGFSVGSSG
jgi:DNA-directed RNA polymerase specialized sigma24 family protein